MEKWVIWKNFNKLPWEWFGDELPLVQDQNAMRQMVSWENDRDRMTQEMEQQRSHLKGGYSSNIRGQRYKID